MKSNVGSSGLLVADVWDVVRGQRSQQDYLLLRHRALDMTIELPMQGMGVLFRSSDGVVRRCWADGTFYERYALRTGDTLQQAPSSQVTGLGEAMKGAGRTLGQWSMATLQNGRVVSVEQQTGDEALYLLPEGFAFFGGGTRGVLVMSTKEPEAMQANALRELIGLKKVSTETLNRVEQLRREMPRGTEGVTRNNAKSSRSEELPKELLCGLTGELMRDPWIAADGVSYERSVSACPCTQISLRHALFPSRNTGVAAHHWYSWRALVLCGRCGLLSRGGTEWCGGRQSSSGLSRGGPGLQAPACPCQIPA